MSISISKVVSETVAGSFSDDNGARRNREHIAPAPVSKTQSALETTTLKGRHILSVDDDADSRIITAFALEQVGIEVTSAASGEDALAAMAQRVPDLLISDLGMPEMDGYRLIKKIRQRPVEAGGAVPAIALTAYAGEKDHKQAISAGFQLYLTKPVDPDVLVQAISGLLYSCSLNQGQ